MLPVPQCLASCLPICSSCSSNTPAFMCSQCRSALYCSRSCQRAHRNAHSAACLELAALNPTALALFGACPPPLPVSLTYAAGKFLAICTSLPEGAGDVHEVEALLARLTLHNDPVQAIVQAKAALAIARELGGCNSLPALQASTALALTLCCSCLPEAGLGLILDTHARLARTRGELHWCTISALRLLLCCSQPTPEVALRARTALGCMGVPTTAATSPQDLVTLALVAVERLRGMA